MKYKGYTAHIEYDEEGGIFHGEVLDLRDVITFEGRSVAELRSALRDSVDYYLEFCEKRGEEPDRPFSGRLMVRLPPKAPPHHLHPGPRGRQEPQPVHRRSTELSRRAASLPRCRPTPGQPARLRARPPGRTRSLWSEHLPQREQRDVAFR